MERAKCGGSDLARQVLQHCLACNGWTLAAECCGQPTKAAAPIKWSPEDAKAPYRRRLENVEDPAWVDTLPKLGERSEEE